MKNVKRSGLTFENIITLTCYYKLNFCMMHVYLHVWRECGCTEIMYLCFIRRLLVKSAKHIMLKVIQILTTQIDMDVEHALFNGSWETLSAHEEHVI